MEDMKMGIAEKIANAKKSNWVSEGISKSEVKTIVELAKISAQIERCRLDMGMTQQKFAEYMGVTQAMVSKWESREYNFTIRTLNEICQKTNLKLFVSLDKPCVKSDYNIEPSFENIDEGLFSQMAIDFEVEIEQAEDRNFKLELSLEGAFLSEKNTEEEDFKQLVIINGAAALISIARGKIESITSNIFDSGKVVIPFVNVIDYYKGLSE